MPCLRSVDLNPTVAQMLQPPCNGEIHCLGQAWSGALWTIRDALGAVTPRYQPLDAAIGGVGVFPDSRAPRVLWFGVEPVPALIRCAEEVDGALATLGFSREPRGYTPHLTLARIRDGARDVGRTLESTGLLAARTIVGTLHVSALSLMQSVLQPGGSVYRRLFDVPLRNAM
jgi:2'-5' RNA ligase